MSRGFARGYAVALALALLERGSGSCIDAGEAVRLGVRGGILHAAARLLAPAVRLEDSSGGSGGVCVEDVLELALAAARLGASEQVIARYLDWRMFEAYAARALEEAGYTVYRGLRRGGRGGFEVDVLGIRQPLGVVFECKHWQPRYSSPSRIAGVVERHVERVRRLAAAWPKLGIPPARLRLVPAVLVLREHGLPRLVRGVPVVPVSRLRGFLEELPGLAYSGELLIVEAPAGTG